MAGVRDLSLRSFVLVLPHPDQALEIRDDSGTKAETIADGYELKGEEVEASLRKQGLDGIEVGFFNARTDDVGNIHAFLRGSLDKLRSNYRDSLRNTVHDSLSLLQNYGKTKVELVLTHAAEDLQRDVMRVVSRFGSSAPSAHRFIEELSKQSGEDIVSSGATTANALGLTTQVPVQMVYWTSGRSRKLNLGKLVLHLEHVASWQLALAKEPSGEIVRALAWAGPERVHTVLKEIEGKVPRTDVIKVAQQASRFPRWLANALSRSADSARQ